MWLVKVETAGLRLYGRFEAWGFLEAWAESELKVESEALVDLREEESWEDCEEWMVLGRQQVLELLENVGI